MFTIREKKQLSAAVKQITVSAPDIAQRARAGQFVIVRVSEKGERIPITITANDPAAGTITLIFQEIGKTTRALGSLETGDAVRDVLGPLGHPTAPVSGQTVIAIGGGVGVAEILPVARFFRQSGNQVIGIIGARSKNLIILEDEMRDACHRLLVTTDDGSAARKGFVSDVLQELLAQGSGVGLVYAIGPVPMMRAIAGLTRPHGVKTVVSLNPIMLDGTGMCGACRVTVNNETKFACVDGPEFDGHAVAWDELIMRQAAFAGKEKIASDQYQRECQCNHHG
jgi:ferredoxin--NADP+ reductase